MTDPTNDDYTTLSQQVRGITRRTVETWTLNASLRDETRLVNPLEVFKELTLPMILDQAEAIGVLADAVEALARKISDE